MTAARDAELATLSRALVDAWNRADWPTYRTLTAHKYRYDEIASGRRIDDIDVVVADWRLLRSIFPNATAEVVDVLTHDDTSIVGLIWRATHSAPVCTLDGIESPSYKRLSIADSVTLSWRGRHLASERHHLGFLSVLSAVPALRGRGECCC